MKAKLILALLAMLPVFCYGQKAFEYEYYKGKLKGNAVELQLANDYIGATKIIIHSKPRPLIYSPKNGVPDAPFTLRCDVKGRADGFILNKMQDAFEVIPNIITGTYRNGKQVVPLRFYHTKRR